MVKGMEIDEHDDEDETHQCSTCLKGKIVRIAEGGLNFYFILFFIFDLFSIFRTRVRVRVTRSRCHNSRSHQMTRSQVT